jgi:SAM-dependent methyltransferase
LVSQVLDEDREQAVEPSESPEVGIDFDRANAARMYDYFLGGGHNFAVDREQAVKAAAAHPGIVRTLVENRRFLGRAVRWCVEQGIDQFLDLGSGVPTVGNVHQIAHETDPAIRVAYVDFEPVAIAHATEIVAALDTVTATRADLRDPDAVLGAPGVSELLDLDRPVALLLVAVLHFVPGDLSELLARYRAVLAPGSVLVISHSSDDHDDAELADRMRSAAAAYDDSATPGTLRTRAELRALVDGLALDVVEPGLVDVINWPEYQGAPSGHYGIVARIPA